MLLQKDNESLIIVVYCLLLEDPRTRTQPYIEGEYKLDGSTINTAVYAIVSLNC